MNLYVAYFAGESADALVAGRLGLGVVERSLRALADSISDEDHPLCLAALAEAVAAREAINRAPSLAWPPGTAAPISALTLASSRSLLTAASRTHEAGDRVACFQAVRHAGRVHALLQRLL